MLKKKITEFIENTTSGDNDEIVFVDKTTTPVTPVTRKIKKVNFLSGLMSSSVYDPNGISGNAFSMGNMVETATNKIFTATERTKLSGIEAGAEVNNISDINATDLTDGGATTLHKHSYSDLDNKPTIPTALADLSDDSTHRLVTDTEKSTWNAKQDALGFTPENIANKGVSGGYAELDVTGKVPSTQLPSYVDDVVEVANYASLPVTGETGKIYVTLDTNLTYRWSGSAYVEISQSLALGETSSTAYRGDKGKTAYDHSQLSGNPHGATTADISDSLNKRYVTDSDLTNLSNLSGTNTGDQDLSGYMLISTYDPTSVGGDAFDSANHAYDNTTSLLSATTTQTAIDRLVFKTALENGGVVTLPTITDNGDGTINVGIDGLYNFYKNSTATDGITQLTVDTGLTSQTFTDNAVSYLYADYNGGTPVFVVTSSAMNFLTNADWVAVCRVFRNGNLLHITDYDQYGTALSSKSLYKDVVLNGFERQSGLVLSTSGTRISTISAGSAWFGVTLTSLDANISGTTGVLYEGYKTAGVWTFSAVTSYDSSYYTTATDRTALDNNKYTSKYFFRGVEDDNHSYYIHGGQYNTATEALNETLPTPPAEISSHSIYVGKIVIQKSATTGTVYPRAWEGALTSAGAQSHSDLANLTADDHTQYALLAGRSGGQTLVGGSAVTDILKLQGTSGNGTLTSPAVQILVGNNGATTAMTVLYNGNVGISTTSPSAKLDISAGNLNLDNTTNTNQYGIITKGGTRFIHNFNYGNNGTVTTVGYNIFVGENAGNLTMGSGATSTTQASNNTGIGTNSLFSNTTGYANSALGRSSSFSNTTGYYNSAVGSYSLTSNTTGYANSALGVNAGRYIADGTTGNTTGTSSLFLGYDTRANADGQTNQIVIGASAIGAGSNSVVLGNDSITKTLLKGNVGVGTSSPAGKLRVADTTNYLNIATFSGSSGSYVNLGGDGTNRNGLVTSNNRLVFIADDVNSLANDKQFIFGVGDETTTGANFVEYMRINQGNVGVGTTSPSERLHSKTSGSATAENALLLENPSDTNYSEVGQIFKTRGTDRVKFIARQENTSTSGIFIFQLGFGGTLTERYRFSYTGNMGLGVTNPTAALHLKAGSASASTAPLKLTSGTLNTTPEAGAIEYNGTDLYMTNASTRYALLNTNTGLALAGGTMSGAIQLGETSIKLDAVLSADEKWSGITIAGTLGATIAVGDLIYLNNDDGRWELVDANLSDGYDKQLGISLTAGTDGTTAEILVYGKVRSASFPAFTIGSPLYMSETAGDVTHTQPTTADACIRIIGFALTAEDMMFNPSNDYIVHV